MHRDSEKVSQLHVYVPRMVNKHLEYGRETDLIFTWS